MSQHDRPDTADSSHEAEDEESRAGGGDAPAAGSPAEREAIARGDDDLFGDDDGERAGDAGDG